MKILNFGSCNIDYVYSLDHIVRVGETETARKMEIFPGGKGLNQSIAVSRAGASVYHAGCIGSDGAFLEELLSDNGVDVSYIKTVDEKNGHAVIQVSESGDNSIFIYPGSNGEVSLDYIDSVLDDFGEGDILLLQNEVSNTEYIIRTAYKRGMTIVFNPSPINEKIKDIDLNMISYLILNEIEAKEISSLDTPDESLVFFKNRYPRLKVMLTLGKNGCVYLCNGVETRQSAFSVDAVDTTAAGDTFTGYFVSGISKGEEISKILKLASAASAIAVSRMGAAPSIPEMTEVLSFLPNMKTNETDGKSKLLLEKIEAYILANLKTANLDGLSKSLGYSSVYSGNIVKKLTGKSFSKLLQSKRCASAADLLINSELSIEEIISLTGYENESFFRKIFKEKYGKSPLQYRKGR